MNHIGFNFGIMYLAHRVVFELFTEEGSIKYQTKRGCQFLSRLRNSVSEFDIVTAFSAAKFQIIRNLKEDEQFATQVSEIIEDVLLDQIILDNNTVELKLTVISKDKTKASVYTNPVQLNRILRN